MSYKPTTAKFKGKTKTYWAVYRKKHKYRGGATHERTYVKRFYVSGRLVSASPMVDVFENRQGNRTKGIKVVYENPREGFDAQRGKTNYRVGKATSKVTKIVPISAPVGTPVKVKESKPEMSEVMSVA